MPRTIAFRLYIDWDFNGVYTDESAYLVRASGEMRLAPPADFLTSSRGIVDRCQLELDNADGRFSPLNSSSPLYSYIRDGKGFHAPVYLEVSVNAGANYYRVFTGVAKIPRERGPTTRQVAIVTLECRSRDEVLLQQRMSSTLASLQTAHDQGYTEAQIIEMWLAAAAAGSRVIDPGLIAIPWAWLDDESALEEIWLLAAACGGRFYCDPDGVLRYENLTHWLAHSTPLETLTPADYQSLAADYDDDNLYDVVTLEASSRYAGASDVLWEPDEPVVVPPGGSKSITARLQQAAYAIDAPTWQAAAAGGENLAAYVAMSATYYAQRVELTITNSNPYWAAYLRPLYLTGRPLEGGPTQEESRNCTSHGSNAVFFATRGSRTRSVRGNAYVQSKAQAGMLAHFLLNQSEYPRLKYRLSGCPGVPSRRLGDRVTINDSGVMSAARDAFLTAVSWRLGAQGFSQDLEAIDASQLYPYQSEGYFVVGTNTLGATAKRIFY